jgi:beta-glucosidase
MASFNSWNGVKMHGHEYLLTDVLRDQMGFNGLVVGDWNGHGEVPGCTNANCPESFNAGVDIYMAPDEWKELYTNTVRAVKSGDISEDRLDDAVRKILTVKDRLGMLDGRKPHEYENYVGKTEHKKLAREAVSKSLVLLKNNDNLLPLDSTKHFLVIGNAAVEIMNQMGGWTITWQGTELNRSDFPNTLSIYEALAEQVTENGGSIEFSQNGTYKQKPDYVISVYGENPYAEFFGDVKDLSFKSSDLNYLNAMRKLSSESIPITSIFLSGRPLAVNKQINLSSAFIAAWLPGQAVEGIADVILKKDGKINKDFTGKLSFTWPKKSNQTVLNSNDPLSDHLFAFGYGLSYSDTINIPFLEEEEIIEKIESKIIFEGSPLNANEFVIENNKSPSIVNANLYTSPEKNISLKRFDLNQQYDSRNIVFNDSELMNAWGISLNENLVMSEVSNPYVSIKFRVNSRSDDLLFFVATCGVNCSGAINLMDFLSDQNNNSWIEVDISYKCLEKSGLDLSKVYIPAMLMTSGKWDIDINKIVINKDRSSKRVIQC